MDAGMEERLIELESRTAFQDRMIEELNGALIEQQGQLDRLEATVNTTLDHLRGHLPTGPDSDTQ
jgi:uncharacterized coiled-coil protein SlyX